MSALAALSVLPDLALARFVPDPTAALTADIDLRLVLTVLTVVAGAFAVKLLVQLVALMVVFVVLADLTAGRAPDLGGGLARLASWRLQGAWLVAGVLEQVAISLWFVGGAAVLVPFGLVTTAAYEEGCGFGAFGRSHRLGQARFGPGAFGQAGARLAAGVTLAFLAWFTADTLVGLVSCVGSLAGAADTLGGAPAGDIDPAALQAWITAATKPAETGPLDAALTLVLAPLSMLPTVYMMTLQQQTYWWARAADPSAGAV